ncbi:uncharacterized protein LOC119667282 [Teleopsis dalmanni]|uniref:uncharacterized protein LOC119667282 n=1 Tax=Teleopsis dalmanni TaxID=139649 RepID=UPI0018CE16B0|nr:uncharacterized protein LOC119667282 [Teleopsis dalmanni]
MISNKLIVGIVTISFFCISIINALKCYTCYDKQGCVNPTLDSCNPGLANETNLYLNAQFLDVDLNLTHTSYYCLFYTVHNDYTNDIYYSKGCVYKSVDVCSLELRDYRSAVRTCYTCNNNRCNSAEHIKVPTTFIVLLLVGIPKYLMRH